MLSRTERAACLVILVAAAVVTLYPLVTLVSTAEGSSQPRERSMTVPLSYPPVEALAAMQRDKARAQGA